MFIYKKIRYCLIHKKIKIRKEKKKIRYCLIHKKLKIRKKKIKKNKKK